MQWNHPLRDQIISILCQPGGLLRDAAQTVAGALFGRPRTGRALRAQKWGNLREKHVDYLVERWKESDTGHRAIEQKLSYLRWLLGKRKGASP
jgi:hypothetical protein